MDSTKVNRLLNEKYNLITDIVKKYNYSEELHCMLTLIYIAFCMRHGKKECDYALYDLMDKVKVFYDIGTINDVAIKNGFGSLPGGAAAVTIFTPNLKVFDDPTLKQNPQTILMGTHVDQYIATNILKMEFLVHEIRHALMGYNNTNILIDDKTYYMRSGFNETYYTKKDDSKDNFDTKTIGLTLDEVLNTYITQILINSILHLKKYSIDNPMLKKYLNTLQTGHDDGMYRVIGYNSEVRLMYPLLLNNMFVDLCDEHQFSGELEPVKQFISNNSSYCDYDKFCAFLDMIYENNNKYNKMLQSGNIDKDWVIKFCVPSINEFKKIVLDLNDNINGKVLKK